MHLIILYYYFRIPNHLSMKKLTIALANNHTQLRRNFADLLTSLGYNVLTEAENGADLLQQLITSNELPDVCIIDLHMPVMDGFTLTQKLREIYPGMKVVAFSMSGNKEEIEKILVSGADRFVYKGDFEELQEVLLSYC